ncbi:hypothetical protein HDU91_005068, partial [Kappamyces sp. JEL0680]
MFIATIIFILDAPDVNISQLMPKKLHQNRKISRRNTIIAVFLQLLFLSSTCVFSAKFTVPLVNCFSTPLDFLPLYEQYSLLFAENSNPLTRFWFGYDFELTGKRLRFYHMIHEMAVDQSLFPSQRPKLQLSLLRHIDTILFPWIFPAYDSSLAMKESFTGDGIVVCVNDKYMNDAFTTINIIRNVLNCTLPIEVFYTGNQDLSLENREILEGLPKVKTRNVYEIFDINRISIFGYAIKPFALLGSSFRKVILIDADVMFFQTPSVLLESHNFRTTGAIFFKDRVIKEGNIPASQLFVHSLLPKPIHEKLSTMDFFRGLTFHTQESGV